MRTLVFILNSAMTLPFGLAALFAPAAVFAAFGIALDSGGELVTRGYAATCLGYGTVFALLRNAGHAETIRALLWGSLIFNGIEAAVQAMAFFQAIAGASVWGTVTAHAILFGVTAKCLFGTQADDLSSDSAP